MSKQPLEHLKHIAGTQAPVMVDIPSDDHWIQDMHLKKGAFTKQAHKAGFSNVQKYAKWVLDPRNKSRTTETTKRRARLAQTFANMHGKGYVPWGSAGPSGTFNKIPELPKVTQPPYQKFINTRVATENWAKEQAKGTQPIGKGSGGAVAHNQVPGFLLQTSDIDDYLKQRVPNFVGTYSKKNIPKLKKAMERMPQSFAVINLDDNQGSHWVSLVHENGNFFWLDPLGSIPPKIAMKHLDPYWNEDIYQRADGAEADFLPSSRY